MSTLNLEKLIEQWEPKLRDAILKSIEDATTRINLSELEKLIKARDVEGVLRLVGLTSADFTPAVLTHARIFNETGVIVANSIPAIPQAAGYGLHILFDVRNPVAERWVKTESSRLVQEITADQRLGIRNFLERGLQRGANPRTTAFDLAGRLDPRTRKRVGGIIGLHSEQIDWVENYAGDLSSSDPVVLRKLLNRQLRDKRFDRTVLKAIEDKTGLPADIQAKMRLSYTNRALKWRADNISRTETARAVGAAQTETYRQAIDDGKLNADTITRYPVDAGDGRVRKTHAEAQAMNRNGVGWNQPFQTPMGPKMHAPYEGEYQCRCIERIRINFFR